MKRNTRSPLSAILVTAFWLAAPAASHAADGHHHAAHEHGSPTATLQLDAGKKWGSDEALRSAMGAIRRDMAAALRDIHENRLPASAYGKLAGTVESEVGKIVANCKLAPEADAQLHLIVADLLAGAEQMSGKVKKAKRRDGAVKVIAALENYATYFDDAQFKPLAH